MLTDDVWEGTVLAINTRTGETLRVAFMFIETPEGMVTTVMSSDAPGRREVIQSPHGHRCQFVARVFEAMRRICHPIH